MDITNLNPQNQPLNGSIDAKIKYIGHHANRKIYVVNI